MTPFNSGSQNVTADGVIGTSAAPTRVYSAHVISSGGGAASVLLRNGTSTGGTIYLQLDGTTSKGVTFTFGTHGQVFPAGCFVDVDGNTTSVLVAFSQ